MIRCVYCGAEISIRTGKKLGEETTLILMSNRKLDKQINLKGCSFPCAGKHICKLTSPVLGKCRIVFMDLIPHLQGAWGLIEDAVQAWYLSEVSCRSSESTRGCLGEGEEKLAHVSWNWVGIIWSPKGWLACQSWAPLKCIPLRCACWYLRGIPAVKPVVSAVLAATGSVPRLGWGDDDGDDDEEDDGGSRWLRIQSEPVTILSTSISINWLNPLMIHWERVGSRKVDVYGCYHHFAGEEMGSGRSARRYSVSRWWVGRTQTWPLALSHSALPPYKCVSSQP